MGKKNIFDSLLLGWLVGIELIMVSEFTIMVVPLTTIFWFIQDFFCDLSDACVDVDWTISLVPYS